jgi:hypothetical protein
VLQQGNKNVGKVNADGYDIEASYIFNTGLGNVVLGMNRAHFLSYENSCFRGRHERRCWVI